MTLIEVIDNARSLANEPLDSSRTFPDNTSSFWTDTVLTNYVNMVQQDVSLEIVQTFEDFFLTQTNLSIVTGTAEYDLPARFIKVRRVEDFRGTDPVEILPITINERGIVVPFSNPTTENFWRSGYYLRGNQIVFDDTPTFSNASAVRMFYIRALADLTAGSASSEIPVEHHRILVWGVVRMMMYQQQADTTKADIEYEKQLQKLRAHCENRQIQRPRKVKQGMRGRY